MHAPVVTTNHLCVRFGALEVLHDISFRVQEQDFLAILGPNGSGKTTLMKSLLGLVPAYAGELRVFGGSAGDADPRRIGYVPQIKTLDRSFPAITLELVLTGLHLRWPARISDEDRSTARRTLERVGADHLAGRSLGKLSGGELQRVYLARAMVRRPELILLDEPVTAIDTAGASDLYNMLEDYQTERRATVIMVTHDLHAALHHASHVLLIDKRQLSFGRPGEALSEEHLREAFGHVGHAHLMQSGGDTRE